MDYYTIGVRNQDAGALVLKIGNELHARAEQGRQGRAQSPGRTRM